MEIDQNIIKSTLKFLGLMFMICGSILTFFQIFTSGGLYYIIETLLHVIPPLLILSVGVAIYMLSNAFK